MAPALTKKPSQLLLSSDSSSSSDFPSSPSESKPKSARRGQESPAKRGKLPLAPKTTNEGLPPRQDVAPKNPSNNPKRPPPAPTVDALGSLFVPETPQARPKNPPADRALGVEDPLLAVDSPSQAVQRIKSAVISRALSGKNFESRDAKSASAELPKGVSQPLSRQASKRVTSTPREAPLARKSSGLPVKSRQSISSRKKVDQNIPGPERGLESPRPGKRLPSSPRPQGSNDGGKSVAPQRSGGVEQSASMKLLQNMNSEDAWTVLTQREASPRNNSRDGGPQGRPQGAKTEKPPPAAGPPVTRKSLILSKQQPKLPTGRSGADATPWGDEPLERHDVAKPHQPAPKKLVSTGSDARLPPAVKSSADQRVMQDLEGRLGKSNRRISELEAQIAETKRHHGEELERLRLECQVKLAEEAQKARAEREEAMERVRKEENNKLEEVQKQALARQSSMKMRCDASVRELKEKIESLENQLKTKAEEFERERAGLMKSFEDKRKHDLQAQENEAKTHQKELKNKESELMEQQGRVQALTASMQTLTTSLAQMKELNDISRTATQALEEKAKTQAAFINTLMKREESLRAQAAKLMPIKEAKRLAFRALLKGRAVEMISRACMPTDASLWNKAWAFQQLVNLIGGTSGSKERRQDEIESRLMQFRKEQMFLMAENERLMAKVAELQQEGINQRQSKVALMEQALIGDTSVSPRHGENNSYRGPGHEPAPRWLVLCIQHLVDKRLLWAFLRLQKVTTEAESNTTIDKLQKKFNELRVSAYKEMAARIGIFKLIAFIKCLRIRVLFNALFSLSMNASQLSREEALKKAEQMRVSRDPFTKESVEPEVPVTGSYAAADNARLDLNVPLAHQPHYYRQLPSVRNPSRGRNMFVPMIDPRPPVQGYLPHPGYSHTPLSLGVPPFVAKGRPPGSSMGIPNVFPSGPYDATQPVDERGAVFRMRGAQQDLRRMVVENVGDKAAKHELSVVSTAMRPFTVGVPRMASKVGYAVFATIRVASDGMPRRPL
ncbi:tola protein., putative [Eimeria brunetti]|uniref:Tola protein., putative n=1 Tax=Eimeria brunetti TaxID=51314 RepID=U6LQC3_9EIME|nr:tola protein., putative [Eimeria brunetti]